MFAYRTTSGSAPLYLNHTSDLYALQKLAFCKRTTHYCTIPKRHKITFTDFFIYCSHLVEWPAQLNPSSWILTHLQETAKNTSLPSLFDPLTFFILIILFLKNNTSFSNVFVFNLFVFFIIQLTKAKKDSNTSLLILFLFYLYSFYLLYNKKNIATCNNWDLS